MDYKRTEELLNQLKSKNILYDDYLKENQDSFIKNDLSEMWNDIIKKSGMKKSDIINNADIGYAYFYDIIFGRKIPSPDKIIKLAFALNISLDEIQNILRLYGWSMLYPKFKRDSIIIYAFEHNFTFDELQELLTKNSEEEIK